MTKIAIDEFFVEKHQTEPPDRFTDGKLLQAMEMASKESAEKDVKWLGIGTPATRAEVIEKLVSGGFVERKGEDGKPKSFVPANLANLLYSVLPDRLKLLI